jgi:hypothetical protein
MCIKADYVKALRATPVRIGLKKVPVYKRWILCQNVFTGVQLTSHTAGEEIAH